MIQFLVDLPDVDSAMSQFDGALCQSIADVPAHVAAPAMRIVRSGGKRLRPRLTIASAVCLGGCVDAQVLAASRAIELIHIGALIHDDVMDDAAERRGVPTINHLEGPTRAILAGHFLVGAGYREAALAGADVCGALGQTLVELSTGQTLEALSKYDQERSIDNYVAAVSGKTASLFGAACRVGAYAGKLRPEAVEELTQFGHAFGMLFQIIDDVLDLFSTRGVLGKPASTDVRSGIYTLPVLFGLRVTDARDELSAILDQWRRGSGSVSDLRRVLTNAGALADSLSLARNFGDQAVSALDVFRSTLVVDRLRDLPATYYTWALKKMEV
jgi:heptaprenyl diphosphate synthase